MPPGGSESAVGLTVNEYSVVWVAPPVPVVPPVPLLSPLPPVPLLPPLPSLLLPPQPMAATNKAMDPKELSLWIFTCSSSFCWGFWWGRERPSASTDGPHP